MQIFLGARTIWQFRLEVMSLSGWVIWFWRSGFGYWVSGGGGDRVFGCWGSDLGGLVPVFWVRVGVSGFEGSGFRFWGFGVLVFWVLGFGGLGLGFGGLGLGFGGLGLGFGGLGLGFGGLGFGGLGFGGLGFGGLGFGGLGFGGLGFGGLGFGGLGFGGLGFGGLGFGGLGFGGLGFGGLGFGVSR